ncbi:hypothetical protein SFMTTN_1729 [Sulfuriferula multivorans]|uniref:Uncharacterized protein n=1 Tax=Sulfuriferula multivorans TaxID=1559896 RepID=A0A401JE22_9PROT|nr:DsrE family protein [Sulfuriferula multivorans]GBL45918.1 hypothetical protein SFMTTN_1729 [Sulfuriferula multivorans]
MNTYKKALLALTILTAMGGAVSSARANELAGVKVAKAVFDITTGDQKVFLDRMDLIRQTADGLRKKGIKPDFVLVIHGPAAKFATKTLVGTKFENEKLDDLTKAQSSLDSLKNSGAKIELCSIAMDRGHIAKDNVAPFAVIEDNVWENTIVLENKGYAYMPIH